MLMLHKPRFFGVHRGKLQHPLAAGLRWMYIVPPAHEASNIEIPDDTGRSGRRGTSTFAFANRLGVTPWNFLCARSPGTDSVVGTYRVTAIAGDSNSPFTTVAWCTIEDGTTPYRDLVNKGDISATNGTWALGLGSTAKRFRAAVRLSSTLYSAQSSEDAEVGRWYCVAMTYDNNTLRLYVDGKEAANASVGISWADGNYHYVVGLRSTASTNWNGWIGAVLHYKRALSDGEIAALASDPRLTWWFDETIEYRALDYATSGSSIEGASLLQSVGLATADARRLLSAAMSLQAVCDLSADARRTLVGQLTAQGIGLLTADGVLVTSNPSSTLQAVAVLTASGELKYVGSVLLTAVSALSADARRLLSGSAAVQAVGLLSADGHAYGSIPVIVLPTRALLQNAGSVSLVLSDSGRTRIEKEN